MKAPDTFNVTNTGKTQSWELKESNSHPIPQGLCAFEVSLADVQKDEGPFRKFKLITEDIQDKKLRNFHGVDLTRDKTCSTVKTQQTTI